MVRGETGLTAAPESRFHQAKRRLVIAMVEREKRQDAGKAALRAGGVVRTEGLKLAAQQARGQAVGPLVEVTKDEARAAQAGLA